MDEPRYTSMRRTAAILGLPLEWLRREADSGRVPCVRAGRRRLFDVQAVRSALEAAAAVNAEKGDDDAAATG